jgi:hypothetical protein
MKILALLLLTAKFASPEEYFGYPFGRWIYQQTIERCCQRIAKYRTPDVCIGPGEAASTAPAQAPSLR